MNIHYNNVVVEQDVTRDYIVKTFPQARTYPIVVINGEFIGGYAELEKKLNEDQGNFGKTLLVE